MLSETPTEQLPEIERSQGLVSQGVATDEKETDFNLGAAVEIGNDQIYPTGINLVVIIASLAASVFLCALVRSIQ